MIIGAAFAAVTACSVKEDRGDCPCWLEIDLSGCGHYADEVQLKGWTSQKNVLGANVLGEDFMTLYEAEVPRGTVDYVACGGTGESRMTGMTMTIPEGEQCGPLFAYRTSLITECETVTDKVHLHKQYAAVHLGFERADGMTATATDVTVRGDWCGMDLRDLSPVKGTFSYAPEADSDGLWTFRLPRQGDDGLLLDVYSEGTLLDSIKLGEVIAKTGYDWTAEDLADIWIGVDWARGEISVRVEGWSEGSVYTVTI